MRDAVEGKACKMKMKKKENKRAILINKCYIYLMNKK